MSIESNKVAVRRFFDTIWVQHRIEDITEFVREDVVGNDPEFGTSVESFVEQWKGWLRAFPDVRIDLDEIVAESDRVACRWTMTGTHQDEYMGILPTGKQIKISGTSFDRLVDGKIAQGFDCWDAKRLHEQLRSSADERT